MIVVATICILQLTMSAAIADGRPHRVLMLYAYNFSLPATAIAGSALRKRLTELLPQSVTIDADFLDLVRIAEPGHPRRTANYIREKYANMPPDVIVTLGAEALPFILKYRDVIAPTTPIVFTNILPDRYARMQRPSDMTGVFLDVDLEKTIGLAERLQPNARRLYLIAGAAEIDRRWQASARRTIGGHARKFDTHYLFELPYAKLLEEIARVPRDSIVINLTVYSDGTGTALVPGEVVTALANASSAPLYSPYSIGLGSGVLGGYSDSFDTVGIAAADIVAEILAGQDPASISPRMSGGAAYRVDYARLRYWDLSESDLPPGTVVLFKDPTLWEQHRNFFVITLTAIAVLTSLVIALLVQRRRMRIAEAEAALQRGEAAHLMRVSVLGELSGAIAHEISQPLTAISTNAYAALDMLPNHTSEFSELRETLQDIIDEDARASEVISRLRTLLKKGARAAELVDINDLIRGTANLLKNEFINRRVNIAIELAEDVPRIFGDSVQIQQVLLNLLMNAMDAMDSVPAAQRAITLSTHVGSDSRIEVLVMDRGEGVDETARRKVFEPFYTTKDRGLGLGLTICSTIVEAHGGMIKLADRLGGGAVATISLPHVQCSVTSE